MPELLTKTYPSLKWVRLDDGLFVATVIREQPQLQIYLEYSVYATFKTDNTEELKSLDLFIDADSDSYQIIEPVFGDTIEEIIKEFNKVLDFTFSNPLLGDSNVE